MSEPTYSLDDLAERSDTPARTIRYYIQRGLVDRPCGEKRGAYYTGAHLRQLLQIRRWVGAGMSLQRIAALLQEEAGLDRGANSPGAAEPPASYRLASAMPLPAATRPVTRATANAHLAGPARPGRHAAASVRHHYSLAPGIELVIDPARSPLTPAEAEALIARLRDELALRAGSHGDDGPA